MKKEHGIIAITIGIICVIFAFVMTVQLRTVKETDITLIENMREDELTEQAELWKQKYEETQSKIDEDNKKINEYLMIFCRKFCLYVCFSAIESLKILTFKTKQMNFPIPVFF